MTKGFTQLVFSILTQISQTALDVSPDLCEDDMCGNQIQHVTCFSRRSDNCTAVDFPDDLQVNKTQQVMLHTFNQFRNSWAKGYGLNTEDLYPGASNMHRVAWSSELEAYARKTCSRCLVDVGDDCRDTLEGSVAQLFFLKLYDRERSPGDIEVFDSWVLDAPYITAAEINEYTEPSYNLTSPSVLYSKLREIGCSGAFITLLNGSEGRLVVCNLFPAGPLYGHPIYRVGKPCDDCELGYKCKENTRYPSLCHKHILSVEDLEPYNDHALMCKGLPSTVFIIYGHIVLLVNIIEQCNKLKMIL